MHLNLKISGIQEHKSRFGEERFLLAGFIFNCGIQEHKSRFGEESFLLSMAEKRKLYHLHIDLEEEYAPLHKRLDKSRHSVEDVENHRKQGSKHVDIWTDGSLYPKDPVTKCKPCFKNPTSLLKFTGEGSNGLFGYCSNFSSHISSLEMSQGMLLQKCKDMDIVNSTLWKKLHSQDDEIKELEKKLQASRLKNTQLGLRKRKRRLENLEVLKSGCGGFKKRIQVLRYIVATIEV